MKIVILSHSFYPNIGGIESVSEILANQFIMEGHEVKLVTSSINLLPDDFTFQVIRYPSVFQLFKVISWADVVLENNPCLRLSWPALLLFKPSVVALHTWIARPNGKLVFIDRVKRLKLYTSSAVITVSEELRKLTFLKSIIVPNPFNAQLFIDNIETNPVRDFVFLGRLVSDKGIELAIEAIKELRINNLDSNLTIIGNGPELERLKEIVNKLGLSADVIFKGNLVGENLKAELRKHKIMLVPSRWKEPFGIVALEGMACGCIPIVADGGGLPDAIGNAGLVFKRGDLNDLVNKMIILLTDLDLTNTLNNALRTQVAKHHPSLIGKRYLEVLSGVL